MKEYLTLLRNNAGFSLMTLNVALLLILLLAFPAIALYLPGFL